MNPQGYPQAGYPQGYGYPQQPPPPQKKGMSGCLIAALIVGGLVLLGIIGIVVVVFVIARKVVAVAEEGMNAPGSAEVRAAGCDVALVTDVSKMTSMLGLDAGGGATGLQPIVVCQMQGKKAAPSCQQVAGAYSKGVTPKSNFIVVVQQQGGGGPVCKELFSPQGTMLQTLH